MPKTNNILEIKNLNFSYKNQDDFSLKNINLDFQAGKIYAILGQNGSGKTSVLHVISSIINNYEGQISVYKDNKKLNVKNLKSKDRAKLISIVTQHNVPNSLSIYDSVMLGRKPYINISPMMVDHEMTSRAIDAFGLNNLSLKSTNELSGGELQSVAIARAFAQNTPIILMDEPTNNLDVKKQNELFKTLKSAVKNKKITAICVLHDINHAVKYADVLIFMKNGEVIASGNKKIITNDLLKKIYNVNAQILDKGFVIWN